MNDYYKLGQQLRSVLNGLLQGTEPGQGRSPARPTSADWGPRIQIAGLQDLYHPQEVPKYTAPDAGIDNLKLTSTDRFLIPGRGEFTVNFDGYFRIARDTPTTQDWATADVHVNMVDMNLAGNHAELGRMTVRPNPTIVSPGQTFAPGRRTAPAACRISAGVVFEAPDMGLTLVNKEPILLMNDAIESIPPVEDPNGAAHIYRLPLYDAATPNGKPAAYLMSLRYTVGNYVTQAEAEAFRLR
jgi:uncharacterized protein DUF6073